MNTPRAVAKRFIVSVTLFLIVCLFLTFSVLLYNGEILTIFVLIL